MWRFDRAFGDSRKVGLQMLFIIVVLALLIVLATGIGQLLAANAPDGAPRPVWVQTLGLILDIDSMIPESSELPIWWRVVLAMLSVVVFTAFAVTFITKFVDNRIDAYRNGTVRYWFKGHVLFLGGGAMIPAMLKDLYGNRTLRRRHIVILTTDDVLVVRRAIGQALSTAEQRMKITVLRGSLDDAEALKSVYAGRAECLYIVGDRPGDSDYDSVNIACWNEVRRQCVGREDVPCFLLLEHASSTRILQRLDRERQKELDTTIVWRPEAIAQRVLVSSDQFRLPMLDRDGIGPDDPHIVHLVLYGMTTFAQAMAVTAAQTCHFPNYVRDHSLRTKITFIAPDIQDQEAELRARFEHLFALSRVTSDGVIREPEGEDFLDIEWEFLSGNIADEAIRQRLVQYYQDNLSGRCYLTLALCMNDAHANIDAALYLPEVFHRVVYKKEGEVDYTSTIPIFVYQPDSEELMQVAGGEIPMYGNLLTVGSVRESYDPSIRNIIQTGQRINYIYSCGENYCGMTDDRALLNRLWRTSYANRMSSIYCANQIGVKQRSVGGKKVPEEWVDLMARVEHNRWNIEKLLAGWAPADREDCARLKQYEVCGDFHKCDEFEKELKKQKNTFVHYCIVPFDELLTRIQECDVLIVKNMQDVLS